MYTNARTPLQRHRNAIEEMQNDKARQSDIGMAWPMLSMPVVIIETEHAHHAYFVVYPQR